MRALIYSTMSAAVLLIATGAQADSWKDESGKNRWRGEYRGDAYTGYARPRSEGKIEFYDRGCEVKREWKRDGGYKEEVKCEGRR
jgi:hypothetical protein